MAGSRTLKLSILGDVDSLNKSLKSATGDVDTFGDKMGKAGKVIGTALAAAAVAAGALAIKIGIDGVKAAIEDEKAQTQLALALENATGATKAQIAETESQILKMSLASGVADDDLRPALGRLVRSTGDTQKAQELLAQALDISTATGKPLETVAAALSKGFDGNTTALGKLGIGLSTAELKTMSFTDVQGRLTELFGGAAAANAETYAGKIARVQVAFAEAKETLGTALLPILDKFLSFINQNALPAIQAFSGAFSLTSGDGFGKVISDVAGIIKNIVTPIFNAMKETFNRIKATIVENKDEFESFFTVIKAAAPIVGKVLGDAFNVIGKVADVVLNVIANVLGAIQPLINFAIDGINKLITGINLVKTGADIPYISKIGQPTNKSSAGISVPTASLPSGFKPAAPATSPIGATTATAGATAGTTSGAVVNAAIATGVAAGIAAVVKSAAGAGGFTDSQNAARFAGAGGFTDSQNAARIININVSGAIDQEGTARTIVDTLNNSFYRGTGGAGNLQIA
jgi:hypothetical protein